MAVRAKCRVTSRHEFTDRGPGSEIRSVQVTLQPVYEEGSNEQWSKYTPDGELRLSITNPEAYEQFKLGKAYFVDFTPAE